MSYENTQTMMSGYRMLDTKSPKGHKISMTGIQGIKLSHQDLELATYTDKSDADLKHLMIRNNFSMAMWHSTQWVTELPGPCTEQSHSSLCLLLPHMQALLSFQQGNTLFIQHKPSIFPFFKALNSILHHSQRAKQTSKPKGQDSYKIIPQPRKFQPKSLSLWSPAAEQIPPALPALQGGVLTYWQVQPRVSFTEPSCAE